MYRDRIRVSAHIADIHLGVNCISAEEFKYQLYERFIKPIREMVILDIITINGDVSHLSLSFNSKMAEVYLWFFDSVVEIAKEKKASIIIVKGTISHEVDHLNNVRFYENDDDLEIFFAFEPRIIETKGMRVYCLPDIHVKDKKDEKALYDYPDNYFDMILGHGSITETQFMKQENEYSIAKNIVYNTKELIRITRGPIFLGHIHSPMSFKGKVFYINSFTRFAHGEEADKGFMVNIYIPETGQFMAERVINDLAFNFNVYEIKHQTFEKFDVDELIKRIDSFISKHKVDKLSLDITYTSTDQNVAKIQIIRKYYNNHKKVNKLKFKVISKKEAAYIEETEKKIDESKAWLMDKSLTYIEKVQRFIFEEYKVNIPLTKLNTVFTSDELLTREGE